MEEVVIQNIIIRRVLDGLLVHNVKLLELFVSNIARTTNDHDMMERAIHCLVALAMHDPVVRALRKIKIKKFKAWVVDAIIKMVIENGNMENIMIMMKDCVRRNDMET